MMPNSNVWGRERAAAPRSAHSVVRRTADRYWAFARSWLYAALRKGEESAET